MKCKIALAAALSVLLFSCSKKQDRLVLWTNNVDFVSYVELFNASQDKIRIVPYYYDAPVNKLAAAGKDSRPDILAGSYLRAGMEKKLFTNLNSLFKKSLKKDDFYEPLLTACSLAEKQYLIPVSYNLPALVFYSGNYESLSGASMLSFDSIKEISKKYNAKNRAGVYTSMGFGPLWSNDFLYLIFKDKGVFFKTEPQTITYTENMFDKSVEYVQEWVGDVNEGVKNEEDFAFKYLYMPFYNQVQNGRCLFSFASSRDILSLPNDKIRDLDFRWICNEGKIQIEDDFSSVGIYSKSKRKSDAKKFLLWLLNEKSQRKILERKFKMNLENDSFGIAGGFSSLKSSTERIFPLYYRVMISNTPVAERLAAPQIFPANWDRIKKQVVEPYILASCSGDDSKKKSINERYADFLASEAK
ncbi:MAG: ABC transporter substrate-binding protein [Treponema sp.]|nr:ABC transporter substrate-binding protein [Treponema sp.]MEE3435754.1 ABC transporter substrate-binding protein [Treponema sp.]